MHQRQYALTIILKTGLSVVKSVSTPMDAIIKLTTSEYDQHIKEVD